MATQPCKSLDLSRSGCAGLFCIATEAHPFMWPVMQLLQRGSHISQVPRGVRQVLNSLLTWKQPMSHNNSMALRGSVFRKNLPFGAPRKTCKPSHLTTDKQAFIILLALSTAPPALTKTNRQVQGSQTSEIPPILTSFHSHQPQMKLLGLLHSGNWAWDVTPSFWMFRLERTYLQILNLN